MKKLLLLSSLTLMAGCASFHSYQINTEKDGSKRETHVTIHTLWDANNAIAKVKTTNTEKTQSSGVDGLNQTSSGTNVVAALQAIDAIIGKLAK